MLGHLSRAHSGPGIKTSLRCGLTRSTKRRVLGAHHKMLRFLGLQSGFLLERGLNSFNAVWGVCYSRRTLQLYGDDTAMVSMMVY